MFVHTDANAGIPVARGLFGPEAVAARPFAANVPGARPPLGASANEARYTAQAQVECDALGPASTFGAGDEMNVAVRMVIPLRREFGRMLDVSHFLHDLRYAREIIDLARSSRDARLRGYAAFLELAMGLAPAESLAPPAPLWQATAFVAEPQATSSRTIDFAEAKRRTTRHVMAQLGPTSEALCLKIEAAATTADYVAAARRAHAVVRDIRGPDRAAEFGDLVESLLAQLPSQLA